MTVQNADVANILNTLPTFSDRKCQSISSPCYRNAARTISSFAAGGENGSEHIDLTEFSGIGKDLAGKIEEIVQNRRTAVSKQIRKKFPAG